MNLSSFQEEVWQYYREHGRELPWRVPEPDGEFDPYKILVSEIMLQQTQANRVIPKYESFLRRFPTPKALAEAPLATVLAEWNGLGYNRRAKYLHDAARSLASKTSPWKLEDLVECKGIGPNTAAAIIVYSYNQPVVFIETNIRTVFIHHFFKDEYGIHDKDILPLVEQALDKEHPREWYWALMDYGTLLKGTVGNASRASKHYARQTKFEGSKRQVRGQVLRLLKDSNYSHADMKELVVDERLETVLKDLLQEGLITEKSGTLHLG